MLSSPTSNGDYSLIGIYLIISSLFQTRREQEHKRKIDGLTDLMVQYIFLYPNNSWSFPYVVINLQRANPDNYENTWNDS